MSENGSSLMLLNSAFFNVDNYFIKEEGNGTQANIINCSIYLSFNFSNKEFLTIQSLFSEFSISHMDLFLTELQSFENFFIILSPIFTFRLMTLNTNFRQIKCLIFVEKLTAVNLNLSLLEIIDYSGILIKVESNSLPRTQTQKVFIFFYKSKFKVNNNYYPFIDLIGSFNLTFVGVTFLINRNQNQTILKASSLEFLNQTTLRMKDTFILHFENKKFKYFEVFSNNQESAFSFFNSFSDIILEKVSVFLNKKNIYAILQIEGTRNLEIKNSKFIGNYLNEISHFILLKFHDNIKIHIYNSKFQNNRVYFGAFLSFEIKCKEEKRPAPSKIDMSFINNSILSNTANQGGFFYLNTSRWDMSSETVNYIRDVLRNINFTSNKIRKTRAEIGSYIFWEGVAKNSFRDEHSPAIFSKNKLHYQSFYAYTSVEKVSVAAFDEMNFDSPKILQVKEKLVQRKKNIKKYYFCFAFYDRNENIFFSQLESDFNSELTRKGSLIKEMSFESGQMKILFTFYKGWFCAYKMEFKNYYNYFFGNKKNVTLNIYNFKENSQMLQYLSKDLNKPVDIIFEVDQCKVAEFFEEVTQVCRPCDRNTFSEKKNLTSQVDCETCAFSESYYCYGGDLKSPRKKFWRLNSKSNSFLRCPLQTCLGDLNFEKNFTYRDCFNCIIPVSNKETLVYEYYENTTAIGYCSFGYTGSLCAECIKGFGSESGKKCAFCSNKIIYLKQALLLLLKLILFFYFNFSAITNKSGINNKRQTDESASKIKSSYMIKIILRHINYIAVLQTLPFELTDSLLDSLSIVNEVSPGETFDTFASECFLNDIGVSLPPVYAKLIFSFLFFSLALFILMARSAFVFKTKNKKFLEKLKLYAGGILIIFIMDNAVVILNSFQPVLFCTNIGDEKFRDVRFLSALSVKCYDKRHFYYMFFLSFPAFIISIILVPSTLFFKIFKAKKARKLNSPASLNDIGYFILPYKETFPFFELVTFSNKLILVCLKPLFISLIIQNQEKTSLLIMFIYLAFFYILQIVTSPYKAGNYSMLQKLEVYSLLISIGNTMGALIWILDDNKEGGLVFSILLFLLITILNLSFAVIWARHYFGFFREKFNRLIQSLERISKYRGNSLLKEKTVKSTSYLNKRDSSLLDELRDEIRNLNMRNNLLTGRIKLLEKIIAQQKITKEEISEVTPEISGKRSSLPVAQKIVNQDIELDKSLDFKDIMFIINPKFSENDMDQSPDAKKDENKKNVQRESEDYPKFKVISKELHGSCFYSMYLLIKYKVSGDNFNKYDFTNPNSVNKDWSICSSYDSNSEVITVGLMRISKWSGPTQEESISLYFKSSNELSKRKIINLNINLKFSDFIKIEQISSEPNIKSPISEDDYNLLKLIPGYTEKLKAVILGKDKGSLKIACPLYLAGSEIMPFRITEDDSLAISIPLGSPIRKEAIMNLLISYLDNK